MNILATRKDGRGTREIEVEVENFVEFIAQQRSDCLFVHRRELSLELAQQIVDRINLTQFEGFTFRSGDDTVDIEVIAVC